MQRMGDAQGESVAGHRSGDVLRIRAGRAGDEHRICPDRTLRGDGVGVEVWESWMAVLRGDRVIQVLPDQAEFRIQAQIDLPYRWRAPPKHQAMV